MFDFISHFKERVLALPSDKKHTQRQHYYARNAGFKDWQSFVYYLKNLEDPKLNDKEWGYILDSYNGRFHGNIELDPKWKSETERLPSVIIETDFYEYMSGKWFEDPSSGDRSEDYIPSKSLKAFYNKLSALSQKQKEYVLLFVFCFWNK